jgi:sulfonate transport system substrate-binding protein
MTPPAPKTPPRPRIRRLVVFVGLVAVTLLAAACGSSSHKSAGSGSSPSGSASSGSASAATPTTATTTTTVAAADKSSLPALRVGDQAGTGAEALLQASGLLHKLPFTVKFADFTSGPPILQALGAGDLDIGGVGNAPPVFAAAGGSKIDIVGALRNNTKSAALLVPKGSKITSVSQLKGKRIAVAEGSSGDYHLLQVLTKAGLSPHDVQLDYLQPAQALAAFSSGAVDAWDIWSPYIEQSVMQKGAKIIAGGAGYGTVYSYEVASQSSVANATKAKEITEYLRELDRAHVWVNTHPAAWAKTWAAATGLPQSVMLKAAKDDDETPVPVNSTITSSEQGLVSAFSKAGLIPKSYSFASYVSAAFNGSLH